MRFIFLFTAFCFLLLFSVTGREGANSQDIFSCEGSTKANPYAKEQITVRYNDGYEETYRDTCTVAPSNSGTSTYRGVREYYCATTNNASGQTIQTYAAPFTACDCSEGSCIKELPDLVPTEFSILRPQTDIIEGDSAYAQVTVKNYGKKEISPSEKEWDISVYLDNQLIHEKKVIYILVGEDAGSGTDFYIRDLKAGEHIIRIQVDKENVVEEINEENNILEKKIFVSSSDLQIDYFLVKTETYALYVAPRVPKVDINELYLTLSLDGFRKENTGGEERDLQVKKLISNNPNNKYYEERIFPYDSDLGAYKIIEITEEEFEKDYQNISIMLIYENKRKTFNEPLASLSIKRVINPNDGKTALEMPTISNGLELVCMGCLLDNKCYPIGYRKEKTYCNEEDIFVNQTDSELKCNNNFECSSNLCVSNQCINPGLINKILNWFRDLFGITN